MKRYEDNFAKNVFKKYSVQVQVYLKSQDIKQPNAYDKFRDVGYTKTSQNYISIRALVRDAKPDELIMKQIGLVSGGAKKLVVENRVLPLLKNSNRLTINGDNYYVYSDAVGNKFQILGDSFGYSVVMVFGK